MDGEWKKRRISVVPWFNKEEWDDVYKKLYSNNYADLKSAVDRVSAWQCRSHPKLPLGIESTTQIVQAKLEDMTNGMETSTHSNLRMLYAMALVRFTNLVSELGLEGKRQVAPLRTVAAQMGIPEWLVDLRHKATHGKLPSLNMLRSAASLAMQWLKLHYWEKEKVVMKDWQINSDDPSDSVNEEIKDVIIAFQQLRYEILYGSYSKEEKASKKAIQKDILRNIEITVKKHSSTFIRRLVEPGFLIPRHNHLEALLKPDECTFLRDDSTCLPHSLERFWKPILKFFANSKCLQVLLEALLSVNQHLTQDALVDRLATAWVERFLELIASDDAVANLCSSPLSSSFQHEFHLDWFTLLKTTVKSPNKYTPRILPFIAEHVQPVHDSHMGHSLMALVAIYLGAATEKKGRITTLSQRLYTIKDLVEVRDIRMKVEKNSRNTKGPWKICVDHVHWSQYPIGIVPEVEGSSSSKKSFNQLEFPAICSELSANTSQCRKNSDEESESCESETCEENDVDSMEHEENTFEKTDEMAFVGAVVF